MMTSVRSIRSNNYVNQYPDPYTSYDKIILYDEFIYSCPNGTSSISNLQIIKVCDQYYCIDFDIDGASISEHFTDKRIPFTTWSHANIIYNFINTMIAQ